MASDNEAKGLGPWCARDFADNRWHVEADVLKPTTDARGYTTRGHVVAEVFPSPAGEPGPIAHRIADFLNGETPKAAPMPSLAATCRGRIFCEDECPFHKRAADGSGEAHPLPTTARHPDGVTDRDRVDSLLVGLTVPNIVRGALADALGVAREEGRRGR